MFLTDGYQNVRFRFLPSSFSIYSVPWISHIHVYLHICVYCWLQWTYVYVRRRCPGHMLNPHINHQQKSKIKRRQSLMIHYKSQTNATNIIRSSFSVKLFHAQTFMLTAQQSHLTYACLSDILVCVVVEGGPNAAQTSRWVRKHRYLCNINGVLNCRPILIAWEGNPAPRWTNRIPILTHPQHSVCFALKACISGTFCRSRRCTVLQCCAGIRVTFFLWWKTTSSVLLCR